MSKLTGAIAFVIGLITSVVIATQGLKTGQYMVAICGFITLVAFLVMIIVIADVGIATTSEIDNDDLFTEIDIETTQSMDI